MAQDEPTEDGHDHASRSPWERPPSFSGGLPQSPWQPEAPAVVSPAPAFPAMGDIIDLGVADEAVIDLQSAGHPPGAGASANARRSSGDAAVRRIVRPRWMRGSDGAGTTVIDLGEQHGDVAVERAPIGPPPWARIDWHAHRRPIAVVIIVLVAFIVGGSVAPIPARLPKIGSITVPLGASMAIDGARALILGSRDSQGESIAAYDVDGGGRDWFSELPIRQADDLTMHITDGVIIISGGRTGNRGPHTVAVDEQTGQLLWSSRSDLLSPRRGSGTVLMSAGPTSVVSLDKRTGEPAWYLPIGTGCSIDLAVPADPEAPTAVVELCIYSNTLTRFNLNTGEAEASHSVAVKAATDNDVTMFTVDDVVLVEDAGMHPALFTAYKLDGLRPLWTTRGFSDHDGSYPCGNDVCVSANGVTIILDAHNGSLIPTIGRQDAEVTSTVLQPFVPKTVVGTLLLPGPGALVPIVNRTTYVADFVADDTAVQVPLFRPGRTWIVTLSAAGVRDAVQLLDGPAADVCRPIGSYLACMTAKQIMTFWPLPKIQ